MENERITSDMDMREILIKMSEGHSGALTCLVKLIHYNSMAFINFKYLDILGIYGSKIYILWNECCNRDIDKFNKTILYLASGKISNEKIHKNLNLPRPKPFI